MIKYILSTVIVACICTLAVAQTTINGTVTDSLNQPIIGAAVVEKGTSNGRITDGNGAFSLPVENPKTTVLVVTYSDYKKREHDV